MKGSQKKENLKGKLIRKAKKKGKLKSKKKNRKKKNRKKQLSLKRANIRNSRSVLPMSAFSRTIAFKPKSVIRFGLNRSVIS